ncbi:hypothetical protein KFE80_06080 [bacterium SCSIO 12696]|nr:hypothetical protein KFE80_06080 [bacterium SCSIO 12696]
MKYIVFIVLIVAGSLCRVLADDSLPPQTIKKIDTGWSNEAIYVEFDNALSADNCQASRVKFHKDHPLLKEILSIALSAFHSKSKVQIRVSGCTGIDFRGIAISILE